MYLLDNLFVATCQPAFVVPVFQSSVTNPLTMAHWKSWSNDLNAAEDADRALQTMQVCLCLQELVRVLTLVREYGVS